MIAEKKDRRINVVEAKRLFASKTLPERDFDPKFIETLGNIQQPIIVRPIPNQHDTYEIIDGFLRYKSLREDEPVIIDIRYNADDPEVFKISNATFRRKPRTTYERALFYSGWVKVLESKGQGRGVQATVAGRADLSEAEISHYISIAEFFEKLRVKNVEETIFNALKIQSVNKLYELSTIENESLLMVMAEKLAKRSNISFQDLRDLILENEPPSIAEMFETEEEKAEEEKHRMEGLKKTAQGLEDRVDEAKKTLIILRTNIADNPRLYMSIEVTKRIRKISNAIKRIEKEANVIIELGKTDS